ncbi:complex I NDUFA9 subunit family protein [Acidiphilium acidophilum]|uniref:Complex I NDUFA9 subunit family protein n=1 Tax=Acidiphilium acidophilum TaxID=76588 RepID=A0AAW9DSC3_ACIAO|nr:complex I NDUFA9 subunit family protein [Acidiphilium acidophilum]MDX5931531.1 complex I NDUFA9 subunit family protein [Acidiphilium acidophilum]
MDTRRIATVFGASGFVGRYVVKRLADAGYVVRAAMRDTEAGAFLRPLGSVGQIVPLYAPLDHEAAIHRAVEGADVVINLVGILAERRRGDFDRIQHVGAATVARLSASCGVRVLVQISAIGADASSASFYARSKGMGEAAVRAAFPAATILRPSIVFGAEDQFFNRFGSMAVMSPVLPVIEGATRFQPVFVGDVAAAVSAVIDDPAAAGRTYELGGPDIESFRDLMTYINTETGRHRTLMAVPRWLATIQAAVLEHLPGKLLTSDQLMLLRRDNVVAEGMPGLEALGITPTPIRLVVPSYLRRYRPGGKNK